MYCVRFMFLLGNSDIFEGTGWGKVGVMFVAAVFIILPEQREDPAVLEMDYGGG